MPTPLLLLEEKTLHVHRAILGNVSEFFFVAFSGDFAEAKSPKLVIEDASEQAMSIILDYAYGDDNATCKLNNQVDLAIEVLAISNRFGLEELKETAALDAIIQAPLSLYVTLFQAMELYHCAVRRSFRPRLVKNIALLPDACPNFKDISMETLEKILGSIKLVATEYEKLYVASCLAKGSNTHLKSPPMEAVMAHVFCELLNKAVSSSVYPYVWPECNAWKKRLPPGLSIESRENAALFHFQFSMLRCDMSIKHHVLLKGWVFSVYIDPCSSQYIVLKPIHKSRQDAHGSFHVEMKATIADDSKRQIACTRWSSSNIQKFNPSMHSGKYFNLDTIRLKNLPAQGILHVKISVDAYSN